MLFVYLMLWAVGFACGSLYISAIRWAKRPRSTLELPRATARRTRYQRVLHGLDARDYATWPGPRMPGEPPC